MRIIRLTSLKVISLGKFHGQVDFAEKYSRTNPMAFFL
jgi:hypothetical protein